MCAQGSGTRRRGRRYDAAMADDNKPSDSKPGTVKGEIDAHDHLVTPVADALKAAGLAGDVAKRK